MGKVGLTPIIGLAVVVALALAAVFGAMSLTNPAFAAIGQPADAELTERVDSPQVVLDTVEVFEGDSLDDMDIISYLGGRDGDVTSIDTAGLNEDVATVRGIITRTVVALRISGEEPGTTSGLVTVNLGEEDDDPNVLLIVNITVKEATGAAIVEDSVIPLQLVEASSDPTDDSEDDGREKTVDVTPYFMDGMGNGGTGDNGKIANYTALVTGTADVLGAIDPAAKGKLKLKADPGAAAGLSTVVTVTAADDHAGGNPTHTFTVILVGAGTLGATERGPSGPLPLLDPGSDGAGSTTEYTVKFKINDDGQTPPNDVVVNTRQEDLIIEFHEDYTVPSSINNVSVAITTLVPGWEAGANGAASEQSRDHRQKRDVTFTPENVTVDGNELLISLGDMDERDDQFDYDVVENEEIAILFRKSAGISNPTGAGDYEGIVKITFGSVERDNEDGDYSNLAEKIPHSMSIDPEDGGLGKEVTAKGKGFKNGTSLTIFRDDNNDGMLDSDDDVLCTDPVIEGNIGVCTFTVTHPTFTAGPTNHIDAVDGVNATAGAKSKVFELKASIAPSPDGGSPGEMILVQVVDFEGTSVSEVRIGGEVYCDRALTLPGAQTCVGGIDRQGTGSFSIEIPNWARGGLQELKVWDNASPKRTSAATKISLLGPQIQINPQTVVANQRISLIGTGFSPRSIIANVDELPAAHTKPTIIIGGETIDEGRINDGDPVRVDNGGNWSASVDLPLSEATTGAGDRTIRVRDSLGRTGEVGVSVLDRAVTVTPETGRVGTLAVVRGTGFPSKNDEGSNFTVDIEYEASNGNSIQISALTDASGRFEAQLRIPTTAAIPSSNQIHVRFDLDTESGQAITVPITVPHDVPEGIIKPSETSGGPGSGVTLSGEGFKSFVPVSLVKIGTLDVTPSPKPATDGNGMMSFDITIPGLDVGIQTIEVSVGRTTASVGFTVTESGLHPGNIVEVGAGLEDLGDNLVNIWHFNNDTKAWSFYDGMEGSDLTHLITGETYLLQIKSTMEVILNGDTRNLTCVNGNCWNQVVW